MLCNYLLMRLPRQTSVIILIVCIVLELLHLKTIIKLIDSNGEVENTLNLFRRMRWKKAHEKLSRSFRPLSFQWKEISRTKPNKITHGKNFHDSFSHIDFVRGKFYNILCSSSFKTGRSSAQTKKKVKKSHSFYF